MPSRLPEYSVKSLRRFRDSAEEAMRLLHLCTRGIQALMVLVPGIYEILGRDEGRPPDEKEEKELEKVRKEADLAKNECDKDFPMLHANTLVAMWGAFEAAIEDTVVNILLNEPKALANQSLTRVKVPLADFLASDDEHRIRFLVADASRSQGFGRNQGVDFFESQLQILDLSGPVDEELKKDLWEMHHTRNVIVHRASLTDKRLLEACPWLGLRFGELVVVTPAMLQRLVAALHQYAVVISYRLCERYGVDAEKLLEEHRSSKSKDDAPNDSRE